MSIASKQDERSAASDPIERPRPARTIGPWRLRFEFPKDEPLSGPLVDVSVAVKDLFAVCGQKVGAGNPTVLATAAVEDRDSDAVRALRAAGATIAGIARTDELAFSIAGVNYHEGTVANPTRPGFLVGGSSSGPAAAVTACEADLGLGTDTAGSIRVPASYCGLWGLRMTHGLASVTGLRPLAPSFDAVGLLARDPDLLTVAARTLGAQEAPRSTSLVVPLALFQLVAPEVRSSALDAAAAMAARRGLTYTEASEDRLSLDQLERWFTSFRAVQAQEAWQQNAALLDIDGAVSPEVTARLKAGQGVQPASHLTVLRQAGAAIHSLLGAGGILCLPSTSTTAPSIDATAESQEAIRAHTLRLTFLASMAGLPALSVPALMIGGAPLGLSLVGRPGDDLELIRVAHRR